MQSFGRPRPTTNPYLHMLDAALAKTPGLTHQRFARRAALLGRYDVLHFHWPETLLGGSSRWKVWLRRGYFLALLARLRWSRVAVVRTVHNVELPQTGAFDRRLLTAVERRTDLRITLNEQTRLPADQPHTLIRHGHYRDWFSDVPLLPAEPGLLGFVGLVRRYKGLETLINEFRKIPDSADPVRLRISGNPSDTKITDEITQLAAEDRRIELDLRFLSEFEFASAIMRCQGVVLPYRFMHNSGAVLAALSLGRPVLVPAGEVNAALAEEVGPGWVHTFASKLTAADLVAFSHLSAPPVPPRLQLRDWDQVGPAHAEAYRLALALKGRGNR